MLPSTAVSEAKPTAERRDATRGPLRAAPQTAQTEPSEPEPQGSKPKATNWVAVGHRRNPPPSSKGWGGLFALVPPDFSLLHACRALRVAPADGRDTLRGAGLAGS